MTQPDTIDTKIRRGLEVMTEPGQVFEIRSWKGDRISSGYFDDIDAAAAAIAPLDAAGADGPDGIYLTLNPVNPDLLARRANRIKPATKKDASTSDADIIRRRWLPIDIDAKRASGISSTDQEHAAALERALSIAADLAERGWPEPIRADSANGAHLVYRIDLPNDEKSTALIKAVLAALDAIYSDGAAEVDTGNFNASRIWKVYGTVSRKGDNTPTRPHRRAAILAMPDGPELVTREQLAALAMHLPPADPAPRPAGRQMGEALDLAAWLRDHGIGVRDDRPYSGGTLYRLDSCPFSGAHTDGAFAIQFPSGAIHAGCHHQSCGAGQQRWPELREQFEGPRPTIAPRAKPTKPAPEAAAPTPAGTGDDTAPEIRKAALEILEHGDPFAYAVKVFNLEHVGDETAGRCCVLSLASRMVKNSKGLHIMVTGASGKGKTDAYRATLRQVPARFKLDGSFTDKTLFYMGEEGRLPPGTVLLLDDKEFSESIQEILKEAASDFRKPIHHHTMTVDRKSRTVTIPERVLWWIAKVEGVGDDQIFNRMLMPWVDDSEQQDRAVVDAFLEAEARDDDRGDEERPELAIARAMWEALDADGLIDVNLSRFAEWIRFGSYRNRRNPQMLLDMIKSVARLRLRQRDRRTLPDGTVRIYATEADFTTAAAVFEALHGSSGGQESKMTKREADILDLIVKADLERFDVATIQDLSKLDYLAAYKALNGGGKTHGSTYAGLVEKCPAISPIDISESVKVPDEEDSRKSRTTGRRRTMWTFDKGVYMSWKTGAIVWLDPSRRPGGNVPELPEGSGNLPEISGSETPRGKSSDSGKSECIERSIEREREVPEKRGNVESPRESDPSSALSYCVPEDFRKSKSKIQNRAPIDERSDLQPLQTSGSFRNIPEHSGTSGRNTPPTLDPADFAPLPDKVLPGPCSACGGRLVHYKERAQAATARGRKTSPALICRDCYERAKRAAVAAVQPLPGTLPVDEIVKVDNPDRFGRCDVCNLERVAYRHPGSNTAICTACHAKLVRAQVDIR